MLLIRPIQPQSAHLIPLLLLLVVPGSLLHSSRLNVSLSHGHDPFAVTWSRPRCQRASNEAIKQNSSSVRAEFCAVAGL